jgi:hypothetical protein
MYKSHEIIGVILFGLALGLVMFAGLALDDKAEQLEQATWHRFNLEE